MSDDLTPLGRLIQAAQDDLGWSNRELERRAGDIRGLGKSNIAKLKREGFESVKASTLKKLAELLRIPETVIVRSALDALGLRYSREPAPSIEEAVAADPSISGRDKRIILATLNEMKASGLDDQHDTEQESRAEAGGEEHSSPGGSKASGEGAPIGDELLRRRAQRPGQAGPSAELLENVRRGEAATPEEIARHAAYRPKDR